MFDLKRLGKLLVCVICLISLLTVNPVSAANAVSSLVPATSGAVAPAPGISPEGMSNVSSDHLVSIVRLKPYASGTVIGYFEDGTKLNVLGTKGDFYKVDCYEMDGYIARSQVTEAETGEYYVNCDADSGESKYLPGYTTQQAMDLKRQLLDIAPEYVGCRYVWASASPSGFDCSGFTWYVFEKIGIDLSRSALRQMEYGVIIPEEDLQPGDLVFYSNTSSRGFGSHVALYIGNGKIIHASTRRGVVIDDLDDPYMHAYYQCSRRVFLTDVSATASLPTVNAITSSVGSGWRSMN